VPHLPKFAYANFIAAHNFATEPTALEHLDLRLENFLTSFLKQEKLSHGTVILLRSDHGAQNGPYVMNWDAQISQRNPFAYLLVPKTMADSKGTPQIDMSLAVAQANQNKMVTGFDFHKTFRFVMEAPQFDNRKGEIGPSWAYNVLTTAVPAGRSCYEARIPFSFCSHEQNVVKAEGRRAHEENGRVLDYSYEPRFGVCHDDSERNLTGGSNSCPLSWARPMMPVFYDQEIHLKAIKGLLPWEKIPAGSPMSLQLAETRKIRLEQLVQKKKRESKAKVASMFSRNSKPKPKS
jgi:hypothetical protein